MEQRPWRMGLSKPPIAAKSGTIYEGRKDVSKNC